MIKLAPAGLCPNCKKAWLLKDKQDFVLSRKNKPDKVLKLALILRCGLCGEKWLVDKEVYYG